MRILGRRLSKAWIEQQLEALRSELQRQDDSLPTVWRLDIETLFGVGRRWAWEILRGCGFTQVGHGPSAEWRFPDGPICYNRHVGREGGTPHGEQDARA